MYEDIKLNDFTKAYLNAALETHTHNSEPLSELFDIYDIDENYLVQVKEDCLDFEIKFGYLLTDAYKTGYTPKEAGVDFWQSRNGNNAGFEKLGEVGKILIEKSQEFGPSEAYKGEDNKVYFTNLPFDRRQLKFKF